jgi:micrococcal nuclease
LGLKYLVVLAVTISLLAGCEGLGVYANSSEEEAESTPSSNTPAEQTTAKTTANQGIDESRYDATATVTRVVEGDTVDISPAVQGITRVRFIGVDSPETEDPICGNQPYGDEASTYTKSRLENQEVGLEFDVQKTDGYDRLLAYVYPTDDEMFNETLLKEGYAQLATFRPNVKYEERLSAAQEVARAAGRGLWGLSAEELAAQTYRANGIGGALCTDEQTPAPNPPPPPIPPPPTPPPQPTLSPQPTPEPQPIPPQPVPPQPVPPQQLPPEDQQQ